MSYMTFTKTSSSSESKENAPTSPLPRHANDLTVKEIPLSVRTKRLEQLSTIKGVLNDIHDFTILYHTDGDSSINAGKVRGKLMRLKFIVDTEKLVSKCEIKDCDKLVPIYSNICNKHLSTRDLSNLPESLLDLMIIRNVLLRIEFLEEQISSSLSNQVDSADLKRAIQETDTLSKFL